MTDIDKIAVEAALKIFGTNHGTGQLDRPTSIIKAAIEKATQELGDQLQKERLENGAVFERLSKKVQD